MSREVLELANLDELPGSVPTPARIILPSPRRGGPKLAEVRKALVPLGRVRFSGTPARIFVDLDPGEPESPLIGFDTIARSDASGLERAILSALPEVDEIVIGIDGRSDEETRKVAEAYADVVWTFEASDIELSAEEWQANKMNFAAARNLGRARVQSPWALVIDADEFILRTVDLREAVKKAGDAVSLGPLVGLGGMEYRDPQRLALTRYRWRSAAHNQLSFDGPTKPVDLFIAHDTSLRTRMENDRRESQREDGIDKLAQAAEGGDLSALFHVAKHKIAGGDLDNGTKLVQDYRFKAEPHGPLAQDRAWLAFSTALRYYDVENFTEAELWALRAMLDGPYVEALCLLGDLAEDEGDLKRALAWYEAACAVPDDSGLRWRWLTDLRWGRREGIKRALYEERISGAQSHDKSGAGGESAKTDDDAQADVPG